MYGESILRFFENRLNDHQIKCMKDAKEEPKARTQNSVKR
jgi:hypothetical protein